MERESSARSSKRSSPRASSASKESMHSEFLSKEVQSLAEVKARLEEESHALTRKVMELEVSNDALRKQLVDTRRCPLCSYLLLFCRCCCYSVIEFHVIRCCQFLLFFIVVGYSPSRTLTCVFIFPHIDLRGMLQRDGVTDGHNRCRPA